MIYDDRKRLNDDTMNAFKRKLDHHLRNVRGYF